MVGLHRLVNLSSFRLDAANCNRLKSIEHLFQELGRLPCLRCLTLNLALCSRLQFLQAFPSKLLELDLSVYECTGLSTSSLQSLPSIVSAISTLESLTLNLGKLDYTSLDCFEKSLSAMSRLRTLSLNFRENKRCSQSMCFLRNLHTPRPWKTCI